MTNIYDLSKISNLIETQHPSRILVVDTNIIMNDPDINNWIIKKEGQNLFVLSDTLILELEFIKQKEGSKEKTESRLKAATVIKILANLFGKGNITEGIPVKSGWIIGVPSPEKNKLEPELEQFEDIVKAFKRSDTKLLLLTRECHQKFQKLPVTLLTGEINLFNEVQMQGVPCHLHTGFPLLDFKEASAQTGPLDWEEILEEIQTDTKEKATMVDVTLTSQEFASPWLQSVTGTKRFIAAKGHGSIRRSNNVWPFLWTVIYYPQTIYNDSSKNNEGLTELPAIYLDFLGNDNFEQELFDAVADRLLDRINLSFEEGVPTLQDAKSIVEMYLFFEFVKREGIENALDKMRKELQSEGLSEYWANWIADTEDDSERYSIIDSLLIALNNCWQMGKTYNFSIMQ